MSHWSYLPFLLVWALPVVAFEWLVGARSLWRERGVWPWIVLALTAWLTFADAIAIHAGIWRFDPSTLIGLYLGPVPIEEVLFYLLTSTMVVQGYVLFHASLAHRLTRRNSSAPAEAPTSELPTLSQGGEGISPPSVGAHGIGLPRRPVFGGHPPQPAGRSGTRPEGMRGEVLQLPLAPQGEGVGGEEPHDG